MHGTAENAYDNWAGLSGKLAADGYCVFAPNLGGAAGSPLQGLGPIAESARQLGEFVTRVLASTGASKVDIVGHSQGGMMPRYYIRNLGGSSTVDKLVALAPSNHGTDFNKLLTAITAIPGGSDILGLVCTSCVEQEASSAFITRLNAGGETHPSVRYTVIATRTDEVVTPYTSSFLAAGGNVVNTTLQQHCLLDLTEHLGISYNPIAIRLVRNALDPSTARTPAAWADPAPNTNRTGGHGVTAPSPPLAGPTRPRRTRPGTADRTGQASPGRTRPVS